eukprot:6476340-Amphidinium_carterae.1
MEDDTECPGRLLPIIRPVSVTPVLKIPVDIQLTFAGHVDQLRKKVNKRRGLLKVVAGASWGPCMTDLQLAADAYVLSPAEFCLGAFFFQLSHTQQRRLRALDYLVAADITGARGAIPHYPLVHSAGLLGMLAKALVQATRLHLLHLGAPHVPRTTLQLCGPHMNLLPSSLQLAEASAVDTPLCTWTAPLPFQLLVPTVARGATNIAKFQAFDTEYQQLPKTSLLLWTDGSVRNGLGIYGYHYSRRHEHAAVAHSVDTSLAFGVGANSVQCSVSYDMELMAVAQALTRLPSLDGYTHLCLCTDSLSLLRHLYSPPVRLTTVVYTVLQQLTGIPVPVTLLWSPGHCGIDGNELADTLCQNASTHPDAPLVTWQAVRKRVCQYAWQQQRVAVDVDAKMRSFVVASTLHLLQHEDYFGAQSAVLPCLQVSDKWTHRYSRQVMQLRHRVHAAFVQPAYLRNSAGATTWEGREVQHCQHCYTPNFPSSKRALNTWKHAALCPHSVSLAAARF